MLALVAVIMFIVAIVKVGTFASWVAWFLIGMIALALDNAYVGSGRSYPWGTRR